MYDFLQSGLLCLAALVIGCIAVPYLLLLAAPLVYFFAYYRRAFVSTAREVKRLDATTRSPLYAEVSASLVGAKTIRAFQAAPFVERKFLRLLDENGKCNYLFLVLNRWLGFRLDALSFVFLSVLAVLSVRVFFPFRTTKASCIGYIYMCVCVCAPSVWIWMYIYDPYAFQHDKPNTGRPPLLHRHRPPRPRPHLLPFPLRHVPMGDPAIRAGE